MAPKRPSIPRLILIFINRHVLSTKRLVPVLNNAVWRLGISSKRVIETEKTWRFSSAETRGRKAQDEIGRSRLKTRKSKIVINRGCRRAGNYRTEAIHSVAAIFRDFVALNLDGPRDPANLESAPVEKCIWPTTVRIGHRAGIR